MPERRKTECEECGSPRQRVVKTGAANDGSIPAYLLKCKDCGELNLAFLHPIPKGETSLYALDEGIRTHLREYRRQYEGYTGESGARGFTRTASDRLRVTVHVLKGDGRLPKPRKGTPTVQDDPNKEERLIALRNRGAA